MTKQTAMIYFVLDSKTDQPRMRIEDGKVYPDGTWHSWCDREYLIPDGFIDLCVEYRSNQNDTKS
jgi:hypothetical protein